jgi:pyruvate formate lyase activating enzyme
MNVRGIYKTSLIDFPGRISTVLFLGGCNLRCRYCYNFDIALDSNELPAYNWDEILEFLKKRTGVVDGITISGGEPTIADELFSVISELRKLSLDIKIDTNGLRPDIVLTLIENGLVDYFALDIKTSPGKFRELTRSDLDFDKIVETLELIRGHGVDYEIRSTCVPEFLDRDDLVRIRERTGRVKRYYLQQFVSDVELMDESMENSRVYTMNELEELKTCVESFADECEIRGI